MPVTDTSYDPLIVNPPTLVDYDWQPSDLLILVLSQPVNEDWVDALKNHMGGWQAVAGINPHTFEFRGDRAVAKVPEKSVQQVINHFKDWLPLATAAYERRKNQAARAAEAIRRQQLDRLAEQQQARQRVFRNTKI